ncbi:hypothetical protein PUN28_010331 [Cardiocondyla obscurior]|uniref:Uncharacterized protein n=1 Tax=Cardiocondyla obscurior TaxID=286306 RepID=A0AAW2FTX6_9HYME
MYVTCTRVCMCIQHRSTRAFNYFLLHREDGAFFYLLRLCARDAARFPDTRFRISSSRILVQPRRALSQGFPSSITRPAPFGEFTASLAHIGDFENEREKRENYES